MLKEFLTKYVFKKSSVVFWTGSFILFCSFILIIVPRVEAFFADMQRTALIEEISQEIASLDSDVLSKNNLINEYKIQIPVLQQEVVDIQLKKQNLILQLGILGVEYTQESTDAAKEQEVSPAPQVTKPEGNE